MDVEFKEREALRIKEAKLKSRKEEDDLKKFKIAMVNAMVPAMAI